ncbi:MAG: hypothetical protein M1818_004491 [Claussenomyces sp. TS43310]|nr:MAG: hypothetical protein M1818_004491 [Claussenomyces sp. TS43310]
MGSSPRACHQYSSSVEQRKGNAGSQPGVGQVMERLRDLENLVKELRGKLEQANNAAGAPSTGGNSSTGSSPNDEDRDRDADHQRDTSSTAASTTGVQKHFGRLVLQDASRSRYMSSGF